MRNLDVYMHRVARRHWTEILEFYQKTKENLHAKMSIGDPARLPTTTPTNGPDDHSYGP